MAPIAIISALVKPTREGFINVTYSGVGAPIASRISRMYGQLRNAPVRALCPAGKTMLLSAHSASLSDTGGSKRRNSRSRNSACVAVKRSQRQVMGPFEIHL